MRGGDHHPGISPHTGGYEGDARGRHRPDQQNVDVTVATTGTPFLTAMADVKKADGGRNIILKVVLPDYVPLLP